MVLRWPFGRNRQGPARKPPSPGPNRISGLPDHHCPGCGTPQRSFPRYPWYFCQSCLKQAQDGAGRGLEFFNTTTLGGLAWRYRGEDALHGATQVACLIKARPVILREARFGGIVAEPLTSGPLPAPDARTTDLRGDEKLAPPGKTGRAVGRGPGAP